jgi:hypothetical protein
MPVDAGSYFASIMSKSSKHGAKIKLVEPENGFEGTAYLSSFNIVIFWTLEAAPAACHIST